MGEARHLVARQTIEFVAADPHLAASLTARTSAAAPAVAAAIERVLDALDSEGRRIRLDLVEIDLGSCDPARWEEELIAGIERKLGARLHAELAEAPHVRQPGQEVRTAIELLSMFARTGRLPWWVDPSDGPGAAVARIVTGGGACEPVRGLLAWPGTIERFAYQLDDEAMARLVILALDTRSSSTAHEISRQAESLAASVAHAFAHHPSVARGDFWRSALRQALLGERVEVPRSGAAPPPSAARDRPSPAEEHSPARSAHETARAAQGSDVASSRATAPGELAARLRAWSDHRPAWSALLKHLAGLAEELDASAAIILLAGVGPDDPPAPRVMAEVLEGFIAVGRITRDEADGWRAAMLRTEADVDLHDAVAIDNAGLIMLWPFLPTFFEGLELLVEQGFRDEAARNRAVSLLHFLASGERTAAEPQVPLAKLLAGFDLDEAHHPGEPLSDQETSAGDDLLTAMIGHAPMLGRISIGGLRGSFLLRPGIITTRDGHWLLRVERRSFDVLLDRLPWPLGWVRLPWMAAPLQIEW